MASDPARCAEVRRIEAIDAAFRAGDLEALRVTVDDPSVVPNGPMPLAIGTCLVYAIYHSPLRFVRDLLDLGASPDGPVDEGFPPLIAALSCLRRQEGVSGRSDVPAVLTLLLDRGADPNVRGINDWTPLHMAVAERSPECVQLLLARGADPTLRTRIDACDTPREFAATLGLADLERLLTDAEPR